MKYNFDELVERRGTNCVKWDESPSADVIPLWVADMDFRVAPAIQKALRERVEHGVFGYNIVPESYYEAVISWFHRRHQWEIKRQWILYTTAVVPAMSVVIKALTMPGEKVLILSPAYNCFFSSIRNNGCEVLESPLRLISPPELGGVGGGLNERHPSFEIDWQDFEAKCADEKTTLFLLCNPHNPTGRLWSREELLRMGNICKVHGVKVISDEIHCEIVAPGSKYVPFASLFPDETIAMVSPTKPFSIAGLQIANIVCHNPALREKLDRVINIWEHCDVNQLGIVALEAAYSPEGEEWLTQMNEVVHGNFLLLKERFRKEFPAVRVAELQATYLGWLDFSGIGLRGMQIQEHLLEKEKLWINAGDIYGDPRCMRINYACPHSTMEKALDLYVKGIRELL